MTANRRLLMLTYFFPPLGGVGIERTLQHARHLPASGWTPIVVAPANSAYRLVDPSSVERVPDGVEVHRALTLEPGHVRRALASAWRAVGSPGRGAGDSAAGDHRPSAETASIAPAGLNRAWREATSLLFWPDEQLLWGPGALLTALAIHRRDPVDAIYSSAPPVTGHLVAAALKRAIGVPWVADYRDPWIGNAYLEPVTPLHDAAQARLERLLASTADRSVFASSGVRDEYAARYPDLADRFVRIPNGYDRAEIDAARAAPPGGRGDDAMFRLVFTGGMQYVPEFELLLDGLERLVARRPEVAKRLRVDLVGWRSPEVAALAARRLPALEPIVSLHPPVAKPEALRRVLEADAALVVLADAPGREHVPPAKLFDAIGLDRPVLAIAPPGEARRILDELGWGVAADPTPDGVASGIERLMDEPAAVGIADPDGRYERAALSRRLAEILDEVTAR